MNLAEQFLGKLKEERANVALESLRRPSLKTEFEYGSRCGFIQGMERAEEILLALYKEERDGEQALK